MVGLLYALPKTQLTRRLAREGRMFPGFDQPCPPEMGDQCTAGLNFVTRRPRQDMLRDCKAVIETVYSPAAYFGRVRRMTRRLDRRKHSYVPPLRIVLRDTRAVARMVWRLPTSGPGARRQFLRALLDCALHNPRALPVFSMLSALYLHHGPFSRYVRRPDRTADPRYRRGPVERARTAAGARRVAVDRLIRRHATMAC